MAHQIDASFHAENNCQHCNFMDTDEMVQCDTCNGWYHYACAGPDITHEIANFPWNCRRCVVHQFELRYQSPTQTFQTPPSVPIISNTGQVNVSRESSVRNLTLEYLEEKRKLEEDRMNKTFEIQRKFLQERFNFLNVRGEEDSSSTRATNVPNESVNVWLNKQLENSTRQVRFDILKDVEQIPSTLATPTRIPTFQTKGTESQRLNDQHSTNFLPAQPFDISNVEKPLFPPFSSSVQGHQSNVPLKSTIPFSSQAHLSQSNVTSKQANFTPTQSNFTPMKPTFTSLPWNPRIPQINTVPQATIGLNFPHRSSNVLSSTPLQSNVSIPTSELTSNQIAARQVLPRELPKFHGSPTEWPLFISSYEASTTTGGYTNAENLIRLQRCLQGKALDAVRSILLTPENVPNVIETLRMMYGRPDLIIHALILQMKNEQPPKMERLETIINFALAVRNLCSIIQATRLDSHMNNPYLMQEIMDKLPSQLRLEWSRIKRQLPTATMIDLGDWLYDVAQAASDVVTPSVNQKDKGNKTENSKKDNSVKNDAKDDPYYVASHEDDVLKPSMSTTSSQQPIVSSKCKICSQTCSKVQNCQIFQKFSVEQRWNAIKDNKLCSTCLKAHRRFQCRDKKKCKENGCEAWHHILLHSEPAQTSAVHYNTGHSVLYQIIPVILHGPLGSVSTFAYLDGGSGITLLEEDLATSLGVEGENLSLSLKWTSKIQRSEPNSRNVCLQISDSSDTERYVMNNVRTVRSLELPEQTLTPQLLKRYSYLDGVPIQTYNKAVSRILIGLENINLIVSLQTIEGNWKEPVATKTRLGWLLQGGPQRSHKQSISCLPISEGEGDSDLHQLVKEFFSVESFGVRMTDNIIESKQSERAREIMEETTVIRNGQSETGLLWKADKVYFPDNRAMALKRLENLERRMSKDANLATHMKEHLAAYLSKNYTRKLSRDEIETNDGLNWFLPIFPVVDPKKPTKFRIVWDAAAEVRGVSLNSNLLTGPDMLIPLPNILQRFREKKIAVCGDIREMFHQIVVLKKDQNAQRFMWRDGDQTRDPEIFVMQRMTFGATCSPSIAHFIKNKNAMKYVDQFPKAVSAIVDNHYVDDMIVCAHTVDDAVTLVKNVKFIHSKAGFEIRKFRSNSPDVIYQLGEKMENNPVNMSFTPDVERVLGMYWQVSTDTFTFSLQFSKLTTDLMNGNVRPTKREVLRTLMTIFDPLGLLAFYLIYAKILLQEIWSSNVGWDDNITDVQFAKWITWIELLPEIENLQIPRLYSGKLSPNPPKSIELHIFVDASELAYATVAYLRIENEDGVECVLIGSKTRVAPLKPISIPRLELLAGVLGSRFMKHLSETHTLNINRKALWTDSRVLLQWLHSEARQYRQFVAFRIGEIVELTNVEDWRWVPSKDNVADDATKWIKKPNVSLGNRWFTGPEFLREHNNWEMNWSNFEYEYVEEELRFQTTHQELIAPESPNPTRFSKWERLYRAQAYVFRVINNVNTIFKHPIGIPLTTEELQLAEFSLFCCAQFEGFGEEVAILRWNKSNSSEPPKCLELSSSIGRCSPYLDEDNLLRVHGRIDATPGLNLDNRRPIILPRQHRITFLLIDWYHRQFHHGNHETVINEINQRFYVPRVRVALKNVVSKCQHCKNKRTRPVVPSMADLPAARLTPFSRPFTNTGVDYFGPLLVTVKRSTVKRYGVLMTCLTTRAIHIEIADSLDTDSCIMALRNFMVDHGQVAELFSDNGTNFHGSENELKAEFSKMNPLQMQERLNTPTMKWHFNPPAASHMGGSWERLIRSVKNSLYHVLQSRTPSEQILKNVLKECQGIVNSRPLTFVSVDSAEAEALTPNHFLFGDSGRLAVPCEIAADEKVLRRQWKTSQLLINNFWTRWVREYLPTITRRTKWFQDVKPIEIGDVVYIVDEKLKRNSWPKGIVTKVFPGNNNQIRSALVKTRNIEYHRPVAKLAVLDVRTPVHSQSTSETDQVVQPIEVSNIVTRGENVNDEPPSVQVDKHSQTSK